MATSETRHSFRELLLLDATAQRRLRHFMQQEILAFSLLSQLQPSKLCNL